MSKIQHGSEPTLIKADSKRTYLLQNLYKIDQKTFESAVDNVTDILSNMIEHGCMFYDPDCDDYDTCNNEHVNTLKSIQTLALVVFDDGSISAIYDRKCTFDSYGLRRNWSQDMYPVKVVTIKLKNGDEIRRPFILGKPITNTAKLKYRYTPIDNIYDNVMQYNHDHPDMMRIAKFAWSDPGHINFHKR